MSTTSVDRPAPTTGAAVVGPPPAVQRWRYPVLLVLLAVGVAVSALPTPLYALYADRWHTSPLVTTVVFTAYAVGALTSVLLSGALSDRFGRRPVLVVALLLVLLGLGVFAAATGVTALVVARLVHGLGIGAVVVAGGAALLDLRPHDAARSGTWNGIAFTLGIAGGAVSSAALAQADLAPLVSPYLLAAALTVPLLGLVLVMREPRTPATGPRTALRIPRPGVPAAMRPRFLFAASGVGAAWAVLGVFLSLEPGIATRAVHADGPLLAGLVVGAFGVAAAVTQAVSSRYPARRVALVGDVATAVLLVVGLGAFATGSGPVVVTSAAALGAAYGLAFGGSLRHLTAEVPAEHRGGVMSAFYLVAYGAMAVPTVLAGVAATVWSPTVVLAPFSVVVAGLAVAVAGHGFRTGVARRRGMSGVARTLVG